MGEQRQQPPDSGLRAAAARPTSRSRPGNPMPGAANRMTADVSTGKREREVLRLVPGAGMVVQTSGQACRRRSSPACTDWPITSRLTQSPRPPAYNSTHRLTSTTSRRAVRGHALPHTSARQVSLGYDGPTGLGDPENGFGAFKVPVTGPPHGELGELTVPPRSDSDDQRERFGTAPSEVRRGAVPLVTTFPAPLSPSTTRPVGGVPAPAETASDW